MMNSILVQRIIIVIVTIIAIWILCRLNRMLFKRIHQSRPVLQLRFFERIISAAIIFGGLILMVSTFGGWSRFWKTFLGGTAIISAVLIFVAQDVARDILAGLMISLYRPFEIGDRIELEDGSAGIVTDINMRHVVITALDTQRLIIPNSRLNAMSLRNNSYQSSFRSVQFEFHIAYGSDVEKAMEVVRKTVMDSPYSAPGRMTEEGMQYGQVYFLAYEDSSLKLATTVYFKPDYATEVVKSDINLRIDRAFKENGIEIPYRYVNIVQKVE